MVSFALVHSCTCVRMRSVWQGEERKEGQPLGAACPKQRFNDSTRCQHGIRHTAAATQAPFSREWREGGHQLLGHARAQ